MRICHSSTYIYVAPLVKEFGYRPPAAWEALSKAAPAAAAGALDPIQSAGELLGRWVPVYLRICNNKNNL
jgi:hypothetical protein